MVKGKRGVGSGWIDVTVPVRTGMVVWPGDISVQVERRSFIESGDRANNSTLHMGTHTGTHMDAPLHFLAKGKSIDQLPLDDVIGPARVIEISDAESIRPEALEPYKIQPGERILFKTRNSRTCWQSNAFVPDFVYITAGAARRLADIGVRLVGVDYLSVGGFQIEMKETHLALLGAGIWLIEGLDLAAVSAGNYELICLPLRLVGAEGSPARAALRPVS